MKRAARGGPDVCRHLPAVVESGFHVKSGTRLGRTGAAGSLPVTTASDSSTPAAIRFIFPNSSRLVANGYWSLQKVPNINANAPLTAGVSFSSLAEPTRYAN